MSIRFLLCSVCVHLAGFGLLWHQDALEHGVAYSKSSSSTQPVLAVNLVTGAMTQRQARTQGFAVPESTPGAAAPIERTSAPALAQVLERRGTLAERGSLIETNEAALPAGPDPQSAADQEYLPADRLTRPPEAVTPVDPDAMAINDIPFSGQIELTLLIDVNGMVAGVIPPVESDELRILAELVAVHFKDVRFIPGEIDGKAVKSRLKIMIAGKNPRIPQVL